MTKKYSIDTEFEKVLSASLRYKIILKKRKEIEINSSVEKIIIKEIEEEIKTGEIELPTTEEEIEKIFDFKKQEYDKRMKQLSLPEKSRNISLIPKKRRGRRRKDEK